MPPSDYLRLLIVTVRELFTTRTCSVTAVHPRDTQHEPTLSEQVQEQLVMLRAHTLRAMLDDMGLRPSRRVMLDSDDADISIILRIDVSSSLEAMDILDALQGSTCSHMRFSINIR